MKRRSLLTGETVVVYRQEAGGGTDPFGAPITTQTQEVVDNVLVAPGGTSDVLGSDRPDGVRVVMQLHFPKTFEGDLRGAEIQVRGQLLKVTGSPQPYMPENTPGEWNLPVEVGTVIG